MPLNIDREISFIKDNIPHGDRIANTFQRIVNAVNSGFSNVAADATENLTPPPPIDSLQVKSDGNGNVHAVISHAGEIKRNIHYFIETDTSPNFLQPHVLHASTSRTMKPVPLPANDDDSNPQQFYFRAYAQYPGGQPSKPVYFGGNARTPVSPGGTANMTLLSSTGSGTAQNSGEQGGYGFGKVLTRPAPK
jgi:hypothetical protein